MKSPKNRSLPKNLSPLQPRPQSSKNCTAMKDHWEISRNISKGKDRRVLWKSEKWKANNMFVVTWLTVRAFWISLLLQMYSVLETVAFGTLYKLSWVMCSFSFCERHLLPKGIMATQNQTYGIASNKWQKIRKISKGCRIERCLSISHHFPVQFVVRKNLTNCFGGTIGLCSEDSFIAILHLSHESKTQDRIKAKETKRDWSLCTQNSRTTFSNRYQKVTVTSQPSIWYIFPF